MPQSAHLRVREGVRLLFGKSPFDPGHSYRGFPKGGVDVAYGSVSAGRGKRLFRVLFFLKSRAFVLQNLIQ